MEKLRHKIYLSATKNDVRFCTNICFYIKFRLISEIVVQKRTTFLQFYLIVKGMRVHTAILWR